MDRNKLDNHTRSRTVSRKKKQETKEMIRKLNQAKFEVLNFNKAQSVGTKVRFWNTLDKEGIGTTSKTESRAFLNAAGVPVIYVRGCCSYVPFEAIEVLI